MQNSSPSPQACNPTNNNYHNKTDSDALEVLEHKQVSKLPVSAIPETERLRSRKCRSNLPQHGGNHRKVINRIC